MSKPKPGLSTAVDIALAFLYALHEGFLNPQAWSRGL